MFNLSTISVSLLSGILLFTIWHPQALVAQPDIQGTRAERLRGSISPERAWWDVQHYHLSLNVDPKTETISGQNQITFRTIQSGSKLQIDLQEPLAITRVVHDSTSLEFNREGSVYWVEFPQPLPAEQEHVVTVTYEGEPVKSKNPPWSGGFSWNQDDQGRPFIATSCQGIGASIWWPNKDHGYDEPDRGMNISITVPDSLVAVSNGRLKKTETHSEKNQKTFHWQVTNPINNYCVNVNIGNYVSFGETYQGEKGELDVEYWVLDHQREIAAKHFKEVPRTLKAFEHWFGPYPFYEDSYKLVVVPYLGMEHQSSVTYGNRFGNGYRGTDLSGTGVGMKFDFIIVHESGHEWFGNNISMKDVADMWIHESFTNYSECLFVEYHFSKSEAQDYVIGCRQRVRNDRPIIGTYGLHREGSGDMYYKGGNMLHTMRTIINDDDLWREILRGLNKKFWHQVVTTQQIENYISQKASIDFGPFFDQYLRTAKIPRLRYRVENGEMVYAFENVVDGFSFPVKLKLDNQQVTVSPTTTPQRMMLPATVSKIVWDRNFYMTVKEAK